MKPVMKHTAEQIVALRQSPVAKPEPKFKLVKPYYAMNAGSSTTDIIR